MTRVVACIPTIGLSPYLTDLVRLLDHQNIQVRLYVNSDEVPSHVAQLGSGFGDYMEDHWAAPPEIIHVPECTIYEEWNLAATYAREQEAYLLCVTDDVVIGPAVAGELALALDCRDAYGLISTDITCTQHDWAPSDVFPVSHQAGSRYQFATWCFIAHPDRWVDVDSRYRIWYGDDDLIWKVNEAGWRTGYLRGVGVTHHTSTTCAQLTWIHAAAALDGQLWASTHP